MTPSEFYLNGHMYFILKRKWLIESHVCFVCIIIVYFFVSVFIERDVYQQVFEAKEKIEGKRCFPPTK